MNTVSGIFNLKRKNETFPIKAMSAFHRRVAVIFGTQAEAALSYETSAVSVGVSKCMLLIY